MPNKEPIVLTFDFGTQSVRAMLVNKKGNILSIVKTKYEPPYYSKELGYAEQSFENYWKHACKTSLDLKEKSKDLWDDIICVTVTTFRDTFTCTDEKGNPMRDFILWLDQRKAKVEEKMPFLQRVLFTLVGMSYALVCQREVCRPFWIKENEPELWAKTKKFGSISAIINARLTGVYVDSKASVIGHVPFDNKEKRWMTEKDLTYPIFGLEPDKFTDLIDPTKTVGYITKEASLETGIKEGLPLIASGSDKGCETLGSGVTNDYSAALSFGTSATVQFSTKKYVEPSAFLPAYVSPNDKVYNPELQVLRGCWMISWFIQNFGYDDVLRAEKQGISVEQQLNKHLDEVPLGSGGLILLPYWNAPLKLPEARGTIVGFMPDHNKYYIYRAIIEGIGMTLYQGFLELEKKSKHNTKYLVISGGGSNSEAICQIVADIFGLPVKRTVESEACGVGSTMCGLIGMGIYKDFDEACQNMVSYLKTYDPIPENHEKYLAIYNNKFKNVYPNVRKIYKYYLNK